MAGGVRGDEVADVVGAKRNKARLPHHRRLAIPAKKILPPRRSLLALGTRPTAAPLRRPRLIWPRGATESLEAPPKSRPLRRLLKSHQQPARLRLAIAEHTTPNENGEFVVDATPSLSLEFVRDRFKSAKGVRARGGPYGRRASGYEHRRERLVDDE